MEIILVVALLSIIFMAGIKLWPGTTKFLLRSQSRQQANIQARICIETLERVLANGKSSSLQILTPATTPVMPSSQIIFQSVDGSTYTVTWSTSPTNSVHILRQVLGSATTVDTILATRVTSLVFAIDYRDPSSLSVTLQMSVPVDSSGAPDSYFTILLPNEYIRMNAS